MSLAPMSLVADYGESEESSQDESHDELNSEEYLSDDEKPERPDEDEPKLPKPTLDRKRKLKNSVFTNPFLEAENARNAVLETHVKMVSQGRDKEEKRSCWMFKKGYCRFGRKCRFVHSSGPSTPPDSSTSSPSQSFKHNSHEENRHEDNNLDEEEPVRKRKRPGLTRGLIPSKKVLKMYKQQKYQK